MNIAEIKPGDVLGIDDLVGLLVDKIKETTPSPVLYDLGCGQNKRNGFIGVDLHWPTDIHHDLFYGDWSFTPDESVDLFYSSHLVEHVQDFNLFFTNAYKKLKPGGYMMCVTPYGNSVRAWQDPDHKRPIFFETYWYLNREWREKNGVDHYGSQIDFKIIEQFPAWNPDFVNLNEQAKAWHARHSYGVIDDITVVIRKPEEEADGSVE